MRLKVYMLAEEKYLDDDDFYYNDGDIYASYRDLIDGEFIPKDEYVLVVKEELPS